VVDFGSQGWGNDVVTPDATAFKSKVWTISTLLVVVVVVTLFLYLDRHDALSQVLRSWGVVGVMAAILVMAMTCVTPLPAEGLLVLYMKIYGAWWGAFYSWIGAILSSLVVFVAARYVGTPILRSVVTPDRFHQVDRWVKEKGTSGLLFARLLPLPGFIISYVVGTIPSVRLWSYIWTGAVSIMPYYIATALIFLGISRRLVWWLTLGSLAIVMFWGVTYVVKKRSIK
jgi:uncharacterized membrane protein YdjX (TVP38/TMEM64 family)